MLFSALGIAASPPEPRGLPRDRAELGDAFVEGWLSLRRDMDSLSHGGVHPRLLDAWLAASPRFLLRDIVRLSSEPQVVLAAAAQLAEGADDADRDLLAGLEQRHLGQPLAHLYWALRIDAGSTEAIERAGAGLADPRQAVQFEAARALAAAGNAKGRARLRKLAVSTTEQADDAARAIGAYGDNSDLGVLIRARKSRGDSYALRAAAGELMLRKHFPDHHAALLRFDPAGLRLITTGGQYDTWLDALGRAIKGGARTPKALIAGVEDQRRAAWPGDDPEIVRRRIAALIEFLAAVNARLKTSSPRPSWPGDYETARARLEGEAGIALEGPDAFAARVAAAIAVCAWTAERIGHQRLGPTTPGLRFITPGGARAADGNLATSFRFRDDPRLVFELDVPTRVDQLWLARTCADGGGARAGRIRVVGQHRSERWEREAALGETGYFERVDLGGKLARRVEISFLELRGDGVACLAELRLF